MSPIMYHHMDRSQRGITREALDREYMIEEENNKGTNVFFESVVDDYWIWVCDVEWRL